MVLSKNKFDEKAQCGWAKDIQNHIIVICILFFFFHTSTIGSYKNWGEGGALASFLPMLTKVLPTNLLIASYTHSRVTSLEQLSVAEFSGE